MLFSTIAQPQLFLWMMLSGMVAALWYAAVNGVRRLMQAGILLSLFTDIIFALGLAAILIAFFLWGNYGQMRLYGIIGAACGYALAYFAVIKPLGTALGRIFGRLRNFMAKLAQKRPFNIIFK